MWLWRGYYWCHLPIAALRFTRHDAVRIRDIKIVYLVVAISVVETLTSGKLAERIAIDYAANIRVVIERSAGAMPGVKGAIATEELRKMTPPPATAPT